MDNNDIITLESQKSLSLNIRSHLYFGFKRIFDILVSLVCVVFLIPIIIITKVLYIISGDFHSIFFSQQRIGKNGKLFKMYKFRTMVPGAEDILEKYLKQNKSAAKEYKKNKKLENDPRITKMGKVLRKTSLDELPQILNILKGDMSFIGNRPYLPGEKKDMDNYFDEIVKTKPGITGIWQTHGRSDVTFEKRLELEQYYSNNCSLKLDVKIFFLTFKTVLTGKGAK